MCEPFDMVAKLKWVEIVIEYVLFSKSWGFLGMWIAQVITCLKHEWLYDLFFPKSSCSIFIHIYHIFIHVFHCRVFSGHCQLRHWMHWGRPGRARCSPWLPWCRQCFTASCPMAVGIVVFPKVMAQNGWGLALTLIASWMISDMRTEHWNLQPLMAVADCCRIVWGKLGKHVACPVIDIYRPLLKSPLICQFVGKVQAILCKPCNAWEP